MQQKQSRLNSLQPGKGTGRIWRMGVCNNMSKIVIKSCLSRSLLEQCSSTTLLNTGEDFWAKAVEHATNVAGSGGQEWKGLLSSLTHLFSLAHVPYTSHISHSSNLEGEGHKGEKEFPCREMFRVWTHWKRSSHGSYQALSPPKRWESEALTFYHAAPSQALLNATVQMQLEAVNGLPAACAGAREQTQLSISSNSRKIQNHRIIVSFRLGKTSKIIKSNL